MNGSPHDGTPRGPIIVTAELGHADQRWADRLRARYFPPERNRVHAHVTLFRHLPPSLADELAGQLAALAQSPPPDASIVGPYSLGQGVAIALHSADLLAMRERLAERFASLLTPQDQPVPRLHITIQNKVRPDVAHATLAALRDEIRPRPIAIAALASWAYCGGAWSLIRRHPFRG